MRIICLYYYTQVKEIDNIMQLKGFAIKII